MIPKIIHFCWLSDDPYPEKIQRCINSWKERLPDYEIIKWDFNRFPKEKSVWVREAFETKRYAFAADYIRFYAIYNYGGIYLDSDVETLKNFDEFLSLPYMLGKENGNDNIEAAVIGAPKGFEPFRIMLDYYHNRHFVNSDGSISDKALPKLMKEILTPTYQYQFINNIGDFNPEDKTLSIFPPDYFSPINTSTLQLEKTDRTVAIHHFAGSWLPWRVKARHQAKILLSKILGKKLICKISTSLTARKNGKT